MLVKYIKKQSLHNKKRNYFGMMGKIRVSLFLLSWHPWTFKLKLRISKEKEYILRRKLFLFCFYLDQRLMYIEDICKFSVHWFVFLFVYYCCNYYAVKWFIDTPYTNYPFLIVYILRTLFVHINEISICY